MENINKQQLLEKIDKMLVRFSDSAFPDDIETIKSWKSEVKRAMIIDDLKNHDGIKMIIEFLSNEIEQIDLVLLNAYSDKCPDKIRDRMLDKKYMYNSFMGLFPSNEQLTQIDNEVENNKDIDN